MILADYIRCLNDKQLSVYITNLINRYVESEFYVDYQSVYERLIQNYPDGVLERAFDDLE